jgi:acetylornithine deacetylase/succinyl-diaminopimelate desuccinylase-like protein
MLGKHGFQEPNFDMALGQWAGTTGWEAIMAGKISAKMRAKRKIFDRIDQQASELLAFLQQYVAHKSVNPGRGTPDDPGEEESCQRWLSGELERMRCFDKIDLWAEVPGRPNLAAVITGRSGRAGLMFNGHTDTVEVTQPQRENWSGNPWSGDIRNGNLHGRGSTDMKSGNAAFMWAAKVLREVGIALRHDLILTFSIGEETGEAEIGPLSVLRRGYSAPFVVNAEPTHLRICPATMGWFFFKITVEGKGLHPASRYAAIYPSYKPQPLLGVDAIEKMRKTMDALTRLEQDWALHQRHMFMPPGGMNMCPVQIQGGALRASMAERCEVVYAVVYNPSLRSGEVIRQIRLAIDGVVASDTWLREHPPMIEVPVIHQVLEPVNLPLEHPAVQKLAAAYRDALGVNPEFGSLPGPCDANIMSEVGQTTIIFGPGDLAMNAHGANEYVPVQQVIDACKVYASLMVDCCGEIVNDE